MIKLAVKVVVLALAALVVTVLLAVVVLWPRQKYLPANQIDIQVQRQGAIPILSASFDSAMPALIAYDGSHNMNGPALIRVPEWLPGRKGRYYLYFAHHKGDHIRMAYADALQGPWTLYRPGVLQLNDSGFAGDLQKSADVSQPLAFLWQHFALPTIRDFLLLAHQANVTDSATRAARGVHLASERKAHIASPEVVIDKSNKRLLMYYHGLGNEGVQTSRVAISRDGLHFASTDAQIPVAYVRAFKYQGLHYLLGMPGVILRSDNAYGGFKARKRSLFTPDMRHAGLLLCGDILHVFWSRVGDTPESILHSSVDLSNSDWNKWQASDATSVLQVQQPWEGRDLPMLASLRGEINQAVHELRDPYVFKDRDGTLSLLYSGAGEQAIGLASLQLPSCISTEATAPILYDSQNGESLLSYNWRS